MHCAVGAYKAKQLDSDNTIAPGARAGMVNMLRRGRLADMPDHHRWSSPAQMESAGVHVLAVHGETDESVDPSYSRAYPDAASAELAVLPGIGHFDVIDPAQPSWKVARDWITARLYRGHAFQSHSDQAAQTSDATL